MCLFVYVCVCLCVYLCVCVCVCAYLQKMPAWKTDQSVLCQGPKQQPSKTKRGKNNKVNFARRTYTICLFVDLTPLPPLPPNLTLLFRTWPLNLNLTFEPEPDCCRQWCWLVLIGFEHWPIRSHKCAFLFQLNKPPALQQVGCESGEQNFDGWVSGLAFFTNGKKGFLFFFDLGVYSMCNINGMNLMSNEGRGVGVWVKCERVV